MERKKEIKDYKRKDTFEHYNSMDRPFVTLTTKLDITKLVEYCKENKHYYATIGWCLMKAANQVYEMRVRYENDKFYEYDKMNPEFMAPFDNHVAGYYACEMKDNFLEFIEEYDKQLSEFKRTQKSIYGKDNGEIWCTCEPWMELTSIQPPFDKACHIQEFLWDKIKEENGRATINLCIMFHHGYLDGEHIGQFLKNVNDIIENFNY